VWGNFAIAPFGSPLKGMLKPRKLPLYLRGSAVGACAAVGLLCAVAAQATVTYDQTPTDGFNHGLGLSLAEAQNAGVPFFSAIGGQLFTVVDDQDPANSSLLIEETLVSDQVTDANNPASAVQSWQVTNQSGSDQPDNLVLVFQRPMPNTVLVDGVEEDFEYDLGEVSLDLQNGFDWIILQVDQGSETWYYPAIRLGALPDGESLANPFETALTVQNPEIFERVNQEFVLGLPDWQVRAAFIVPEPSTGLLVGLGCAALALRRSRRS